jgi:hypothetical protein
MVRPPRSQTGVTRMRIFTQGVANELRLHGALLVHQQHANAFLGDGDEGFDLVVAGKQVALGGVVGVVGIVHLDAQLDLAGLGGDVALQLNAIAGRQSQCFIAAEHFHVVEEEADAHRAALEAGGVDAEFDGELALAGHQGRLGDDGGDGDVALPVGGGRIAASEGVDRTGQAAPARGFGQRRRPGVAVVGAVAE